MRAVIQRVSHASVTIEAKPPVGPAAPSPLPTSITGGLLVLLGIEEADGPEDIEWLSAKIVNLRIFDDAGGVMNLSIKDSGGDILLVSQFTLFGSTKKGNRPSWTRAAKPETAIPLYEKMIARLSADLGKPILTGEFGADMKVQLLNDGPVTILIDTKNKE
jgi:D-tyrosyl-tRNA(Tyr) deacylase